MKRTASGLHALSSSGLSFSARVQIGSEVAFERTAEGILLRPVGAGKRIAPEEAYGILKTRRRVATEADIARAVRSAAVRKEHKRRTSR